MGDPVSLLLAGSFSPGTAGAGLPGTKEGASWLQALGVDSQMLLERASLRGRPEVPEEKQSHFLISPVEMLHDFPQGPLEPLGLAHRSLRGPASRGLEVRWSAGMQLPAPTP